MIFTGWIDGTQMSVGGGMNGSMRLCLSFDYDYINR